MESTDDLEPKTLVHQVGARVAPLGEQDYHERLWRP